MPMTLTDADLLKLENKEWIDCPTVERFGLRRVNRFEGAALVGRESSREDLSGIAFSTFFPGHPNVREWFLRLDHPLMLNGKLVRYLGPPGRGNIIIFGPGEPVEALADVRMPIVLVEGLKKLMAACRLAQYNSDLIRFLACGITGCWNWRGVIGKTADPTGARVDVNGVIPDFDRINWAGRDVAIIFDSDVSTNPDVAAARRGLVAELRKRGARVTVVDLPSLAGFEKTGFDDFLARRGHRLALALLQPLYQRHRKGPAV